MQCERIIMMMKLMTCLLIMRCFWGRGASFAACKLRLATMASMHTETASFLHAKGLAAVGPLRFKRNTPAFWDLRASNSSAVAESSLIRICVGGGGERESDKRALCYAEH
jgi:hypothetical protein